MRISVHHFPTDPIIKTQHQITSRFLISLNHLRIPDLNADSISIEQTKPSPVKPCRSRSRAATRGNKPKAEGPKPTNCKPSPPRYLPAHTSWHARKKVKSACGGPSLARPLHASYKVAPVPFFSPSRSFSRRAMNDDVWMLGRVLGGAR